MTNEVLAPMSQTPAETRGDEKPAETRISHSNGTAEVDQKISVAPMMDWTDRHCRFFLRGFSPRVMLYTEMITAAAIIHGDRDRLLRFNPDEQPLALQIGGSDAAQLAIAARAGEDFGYRQINLNCGCP